MGAISATTHVILLHVTRPPIALFPTALFCIGPVFIGYHGFNLLLAEWPNQAQWITTIIGS
jgi:hypothetical protein